VNIFVIRHGETDWNAAGRWQGREDIELNENGRTQAYDCAEKMKDRKWGAIFTSPLKRARETADIMAAVLGIENVYEDIGLIERDIGRISGMTAEERGIFFPDGKYEGLEDWDLLGDRMHHAVLHAAQRFNPQDIIIISHDGAIRALRSKLANHETGTEKALKNTYITKLSFYSNTLKLLE
jgi:uncharacterized phosphatase